MKHSLTLLLTLLLVLSPAALMAQTGSDAESAAKECAKTLTPEELKDSTVLTVIGVYCFEAQEYLVALKYYRIAYSLSKSPFLLGAIGRVFEELGHHSIAAGYYRRFLNQVPYSDGRIAARLKNIDALLDEKGYAVTLTTTPSGADISLVVDGTHWERLGNTPERIILLPGSYEFVFHKPGIQTKNITVDIPGDLTNPSHRLHYSLAFSGDMFLRTPNDRWRDLAIATYLASIPVIVGGGTLIAVGYDSSADAMEMSRKDRGPMLERASTVKTLGFSVLGIGFAGIIMATTFQLLSINWDGGACETDNSTANTDVDTPLFQSLTAGLSPLGIQLGGTF